MGRLLLSGHTLYGTTTIGGTNGTGTIFSVNTDGTGYNQLFQFDAGNGYYSWYGGGTNYYYNQYGTHPTGGLQLSGNMLYGATQEGGVPDGWGDVFCITTNGSGFNVLYNLKQSDGSALNGRYDNNPWSDLLLADGTLYGITLNGIVFRTDTAGSSFAFQSPAAIWSMNGTFGAPTDNGLILSGNILYGVTQGGGTNGDGNVYSCNISGGGFQFQDLHDFGLDQSGNAAGGYWPATRLVLVGNTLYGSTQQGGTYDGGILFSINTDGSDFTILHNFNGTDGANPGYGLVLAGDTLYGVCGQGGGHGSGTIFSINTNGTGYTVLYSFSGGADGGSPEGGLVLQGCALYGTTTGSSGGSAGTAYCFALVPGISSYSLTGPNLVLNATNGVADCTYTVLTTTNLALPASQWTPLATNKLTQAGNFSLSLTNAVELGASQRFYTLQAQ